MSGSRQGFLGVSGSNGVISGSIISKMAADGHLGMTALSRITLASAGLSCFKVDLLAHFSIYRWIME